MACVAEGQTLAALENHFGHAAGFGGFDAGEGFGCRRIAAIAAEVQVDEGFIDLQTIFYEGNFQFFGVQAAAQRFQGFAGFLISGESGGAIAAGLR